MPATVSQLRRPILISHTVDFGDAVSVTFRYDRNKITDAWVREWTTLEDAGDPNVLNTVLGDLIESWDVTGDDGAPFPPTPENIGALFSLADKGLVMKELMSASVPSRAEGNASSAPTSTPPSASEPPPTTPPNGAAGSPQPEPSASLSTS